MGRYVAACVVSLSALTACGRRGAVDGATDVMPAEEAAPAPRALSELFAGTSPASPPSAFGGWVPGAEPPQQGPDLVDSPVPVTGFPRVTASASLAPRVAASKRIRTLELHFSGGTGEALEALVDAWGPGDLSTDASGRRWFNATLGIRAELANTHRLVFTSFVPMGKFVGDQPGLPFGFEKQPLLGAQRSTLAVYDVRDDGPGSLHCTLDFPGFEWTDHTTVLIDVGGVGGRIRGYAFEVGYAAHPTWKFAVRSLLIEKLGEPTSTTNEHETTVVRFAPNGATVCAYDDGKRWFIEVSAVK